MSGAVWPRAARGKVEALLDLLGNPWPWDQGLSCLMDEALCAEEALAA